MRRLWNAWPKYGKSLRCFSRSDRRARQNILSIFLKDTAMITGENTTDMTPALAVHPGELLKDELEARHMTQKELSRVLGFSYTVLNEIINGKRAFPADLALMLEELWGTKAYIWVNLQTDYTLQMVRTDKSIMQRLANIRKIASVL